MTPAYCSGAPSFCRRYTSAVERRKSSVRGAKRASVNGGNFGFDTVSIFALVETHHPSSTRSRRGAEASARHCRSEAAFPADAQWTRCEICGFLRSPVSRRTSKEKWCAAYVRDAEKQHGAHVTGTVSRRRGPLVGSQRPFSTRHQWPERRLPMILRRTRASTTLRRL
eukprot:scaffold48_cov311-Pinguiococcus_pyrenoidosus.AAC.310